MNFETFRYNKKNKQKNKKRKEKYSNSKNFVSPDTLSDKFPANCTKHLQHFILSIPFFLISLHKIPFKKLYCLCYPFEPISELESCGTYCLILLTEITVNATRKPP